MHTPRTPTHAPITPSIAPAPRTAAHHVRVGLVACLALGVAACSGCGSEQEDDGRRATVGVLGDLIFQGRIQQQAFASPAGARSLLADIEDLIAAPDVTYGNFEGVASCCRDTAGVVHPDPGARFDGVVYSSTTDRGLNTTPRFVVDLTAAGIDVMSTANNHALDRARFGALATLDAMDAAGALHTGTRRSADEPWHTLVHAGGLTIAFLACTEWTNGPDDEPDTVLYCYEREDEIMALVRALRADPNVDAVLVTPHAGRGEQAGPDTRYRAFARALADAGATAVLGNGRHTVQKHERYTTFDGRKAVLMYSIGNVFADKPEAVSRTSVFLQLTLARHRVVSMRWAPLVFPDADAGDTTPRSVEVAEPEEDGLIPLPSAQRLALQGEP